MIDIKKSTFIGVIIEALPNTAFKAKLEEDGREILAHLSGKMRLHFIRVLVGDRVEIEILPGDTRGRIVKRL